MTPLNWLRSRRTANYTPPARAPEPPPAADPAAQPTGFITFNSALTEAEVDGLRAAFTAALDAATPLPIVALDTPADSAPAAPQSVPPAIPANENIGAYYPGRICPACSPRYSRCYAFVHHPTQIRAQNINRTDNTAGQERA